jgi:hypothetical protein
MADLESIKSSPRHHPPMKFGSAKRALEMHSHAADRASTSRYGAGSRVHGVSAEAPCAEFHKPLPQKRALMAPLYVKALLWAGLG